jgi:hypothetical protein
MIEPVSAFKFPANREINREFRRIRPLSCDFDVQSTRGFNGFQPNSLHNRTGNFFRRTGKDLEQTGNLMGGSAKLRLKRRCSAHVAAASKKFRQQPACHLSRRSKRHACRWHVHYRTGFAAYWRLKSRSAGGRPRIAKEVRDLIRRMSLENPLWHSHFVPLAAVSGCSNQSFAEARLTRSPRRRARSHEFTSGTNRQRPTLLASLMQTWQ